LQYLPVSDLADCVGKPASELCQACVDGVYPTPAGRRLYQLAVENDRRPELAAGSAGRTYEVDATPGTCGTVPDSAIAASS
jgi:amidophosphoribosyltransferase